MEAKSRLFVAAVADVLVLLFLATAALAGCGAASCTLPPAEKSALQATCPVMGGKVNKSEYVDVKGFRVYVCCPGCKATIKADPDKYLAKIRANGEEPVSLASLEPPTIATPALATLIKARVPLVLLDARTGKFDDGRRIPGAKSLNAKATAKQAAGLIKTKGTLVVTYCAGVKCPASHLLAERLQALGYTNVLEYTEGIAGWAKTGQSVDTVRKPAPGGSSAKGSGSK